VLLSKLPPKGPDSAPRPQADAAQRALADRQAELAAVDSDLRGLLATVDSQRDERLQAARRGMQDRIDNTLASREQELLAADNVQLAREASQIDRQIRTLMTQASTLASSQAAQPERRLGPVTVDVAAPPASAMSGVDASIAALGREKRRWIQYVRDEARMAALDVAAQKRWSISFAPGRGEHDLTGPVADTLKAGAWRS